MKTITLKVNNTDVLVSALSLFSLLKKDGLQELWLDFGKLINHKIIPVHHVAASLGQDFCDGMLFFHSFSGSDNISAMKNKGKNTMYNIWCALPEVPTVFSKISNCPTHMSSRYIDLIERFAIIAYDKSSQSTKVDEARLELFAHKNKPYDSIPPTLGALTQHILRAAYQAGWV